MNRQEFAMQVERLQKTWGGNALPTERVAMLWDRVGSLSASWFKSTVDQFIGYSRQCPTLAEFDDPIRTEMGRVRGPREEWSPSVADCSDCLGAGVFLTQRKDEPGFWAFKCECRHGRTDPRRLPRFGQEHADDGHVWMDPRNLRAQQRPIVSVS